MPLDIGVRYQATLRASLGSPHSAPAHKTCWWLSSIRKQTPRDDKKADASYQDKECSLSR